MTEFHIRLQDALTRSGLSQSELCERTGIPKSAMSQYLSGAFKPKQDRTYLLAQALNVSAAWLMGYDLPSESGIPPGFIPVPKMQKVPVVGRIACGTPITAEENREGYIDAPEGRHVDFALICSGDSMIDAGIKDGDIVYIRKQPQVENGQIAAVRIDNEATLKRVYFHGNTLILQPANANYPPMSFYGAELENVIIEGLAVGFTHWF